MEGWLKLLRITPPNAIKITCRLQNVNRYNYAIFEIQYFPVVDQ